MIGETLLFIEITTQVYESETLSISIEWMFTLKSLNLNQSRLSDPNLFFIVTTKFRKNFNEIGNFMLWSDGEEMGTFINYLPYEID